MAMIVDAIVGKLLERVMGVVEEKAIMVLGVKDELQKLQRTMKRVGLLLKDAEKKSIEDESIKGWIAELKDFMYDADDIIDRCMHEGTKILQDEPDRESSASQKVCCKLPLFSCVQSLQFRHAIANDIKGLNEKLDEIDKSSSKFHLQPSGSNHVHTTNRAAGRHSSSLVESDVVGFENATRSLVESLISVEEQNCLVFSIVGMGGIGKTTLAQCIFNDPRIKNNFLLHSWSCVSKLSESDLLKEIIRNCEGHCGESTTITELQKILRDTIHGKHLFLVLDDIWDSNIWEDSLRNPVVGSGATKVRVLITTRDKNVAQKLGSFDHIHNVDKLSTASGWELLCKKVFAGRNLEDMQNLKDVGMQIVEKCDGLPLAIKTIAGVLITKDRSQKEWKRVLENSAWNTSGLPEELHRALYISYEALSSPLRRCFLHCSLCPDKIQSYYVVCEWIAEGYIKEDKNEQMEDIAEDYYKELIKRSLIQPNKRESADESVCTMHDSLRTLAHILGQDENLHGDPQEADFNSTTSKLRRLAISSTKDIVSLPQVILGQKCLRTLLLSTPPTLEMDVITSFSLLRVLRLNGEMITHLPNKIGDLVHLRLLDLDYTTLQELPDSLGRLTNLQFLTLVKCEALQTLPKSITKLCNLRCLDLEGSSVNHVPKGIGKLGKLNVLDGFIIGNGVDGDGQVQEGCDLGDLQSLNNLRRIEIKELERAKEGSAAVLSTKRRLNRLELSCTPQSERDNHQAYTEQETSRIEQVFDGLCPPSCLEKLWIKGFFGSRYPSWMSYTSVHTCLADLIYLVLIDCTSCPCLPSLGQLPHLKYLKIKGATAVVSIGPEFLGNRKPPTAFPKLEYLLMWNMPNWEEWSLTGEDNEKESSKLLHFPHLVQLFLNGCPKLRALPKDLHQVGIKELLIQGADSLEAVKDMPSLTEALKIIDNENLSRVSNLPALKRLIVKNCPMLKNVEKLDSLQSLRFDDKESSNLPEWLIDFLREKQQSTFDNQFELNLYITVEALKGCLKGSPAWSVLEQVPKIRANATLVYDKSTSFYDTSLPS